MRMKEDRGAEQPWPKPAYNVQIGTEGQFIVGFSVHGNAGDPTCLIPHLEQAERNLGRLPANLIADAAYGSEENYAYVERHQLGNFLKYTTFYQDTQHYRKPAKPRAHQFRAEHFRYDAATDEFICPADQRLTFTYESQYTTTNQYVTRRRHYAAAGCDAYPFKPQCTQAKGHRHIRISHKLLAYRRQARGESDIRRRPSLACRPLHRSGNRLWPPETQSRLPTVPSPGAPESQNGVGLAQHRPQYAKTGGEITASFLVLCPVKPQRVIQKGCPGVLSGQPLFAHFWT